MGFTALVDVLLRRFGPLGALICVTGTGLLHPQPVWPASAGLRDGQRVYQRYCAACHGENGAGRGPAHAAFRVPPTDLTALTRQHGVFPRSELLKVLDQTKAVDAHGSRDLPIWGDAFWRPAGEDEVERSPESRTMDDILDFVEGLQTPEPTAP